MFYTKQQCENDQARLMKINFKTVRLRYHNNVMTTNSVNKAPLNVQLPL